MRKTLILVSVLLISGAVVAAWYVRSADTVGGARWSTVQGTILTLEEDVRRGNLRPSTHTQLGHAYLQHARETGDGASTDRAERAFTKALDQDARDFEAMNGMAMVYLTRHQFREALSWGRRSLEVNPHRAFTYGILVDAHIELGEYDEALQTGQKMVDMRPDLSSYSRVSYLRELRGDMDGAIEAMEWAVSAGSGYLEHVNWCRVYLGHLHLHRGDLEAAEAQYQIGLAMMPSYGHALAGIARVRLAQERHDAAVSFFEEALSALPIPEYAIALGEALEAAGRLDDAAAQYEAAVDVLEDEIESGMDVDEELADLLLRLDRELPRALRLAEAAYARRPTVKNAEILAWAQFKNGRPAAALERSRESLRLGTKHVRAYYRAGRIAIAAGLTEEGTGHLRRALELNPHSPEGTSAAAILRDRAHPRAADITTRAY